MDVIATLITGIWWGLILNACWMTPYFVLLLYHFSKQDDPLYMSEYEKHQQLVRDGKITQAAKESFNKGGISGKKAANVSTSKIRRMISQIKSYWKR